MICAAATGTSVAQTSTDLWYGHGTTSVVMRSPQLLVAGIDSKETYLYFTESGVRREDREVCKAARLGSDFAMVAGLDRGGNGADGNGADGNNGARGKNDARGKYYDALGLAASVWQPGDDLNALASKTEGAVAPPLIALLSQIRVADPTDFNRRFRGQTVAEIGLFGVENRVPRLVILEFTEVESAAGPVSLSLRETRCPGACSAASTAYFLGSHDEIEGAVRRNPKLLSPPSDRNVETLIRLEMLHRPDIVGGPVALVAMNQAGVEFVNPGICSSLELSAR